MASVSYLCGPPGCGKTRAVRARHLAALREGVSDRVILLVPDAATAASAREDLARETGGLYDARIMTFDDLARALLRSNRDPLAPLEPCQRLLLARRLAEEAEVALPLDLLRRPGFVPALCSFVDELKRAAVDPAAFTAAVRQSFRGDERAQSLARFYVRYQDELTRRNLYDEPGLFWQATHLLSQGQDHPFGAARLVLVDGFTDFTTTQLQVLQHLASGREVVVTLTLAPEDERREAFAAAWRLLERLQQHLPPGDVQWLAHCDERPAPLQHVRDWLFMLRPPVLEDAGGALGMVAAPGILAEAREILREVKALLLDGVSPDDICLIFRALPPYRRALHDVARETGVPLAVRDAETLAARPSVQVVLDLLQIVRGDYAQPDVVKFLKSNFVDLSALSEDASPLSPEEFEIVACEARVIGGRQQWTDQLRLYGDRLQQELRLAREGEGLEEDVEARSPQYIEGDRRRLERAAALFSALATRLDQLDRRQTRGEHVRRLLAAIEDFAVPGRLVRASDDCPADPTETSANLAAFRALLQVLHQVADADQLLGAPEAVPFADFCQELAALCADTAYDLPPAREGRVLALDAYRARQLRKPYVFIGGLVEGQWPAVSHEPAFFDDRERRRLGQAGVPLDLSSDRQHDETYLFLLACAVADTRLTLSVPTMDPGGEPLPRSHYVDEVARLFAPGALPVRERTLSQIIPPPQEIVCLRELLEYVTDQQAPDLLEAVLPQLGDAERELAAHARAMAAVEQQRYDFATPFESHDGVLHGAALRAELVRRFGPDHKWSASALGLYGGCPFRFFLERVLRLQPLEMPQEEVEVSDLGTLAHRILRRFFAAHKAQHADKPLSAQDLGQAQEAMRRQVAETFAEWERQGLVTHRKLWELARQRLAEDLLALVAYEQEELAKTGLVPRAFEADYDLGVTPEGADETLLIHGHIDRVDVQPRVPGGEPQHYAVYDYKGGGGTSPGAIEAGQDFQMPFYALGAAAAVLGGQDPPPQCLGWAYYKYRQPPKLTLRVGQDKRYLTPDEYIRSALGWAMAHVWHIRRGRFPVDPNDCAYCDFGGVCRFFPWRSEAKAGGESDAS